MKNLFFKLTIILLGISNIEAQNNFIGTWENQVGNEIFRVSIWLSQDGNYLNGHYEKVINNNDIETYIYCSDKEKFIGNNSGWLPTVFWLQGDNQLIGGAFIDNTVNSNLYDQQKLGSVKIEIISSNTLGSITAQWTVIRGQGPYINEAPEFSVPTNIVMTKVE